MFPVDVIRLWKDRAYSRSTVGALQNPAEISPVACALIPEEELDVSGAFTQTFMTVGCCTTGDDVCTYQYQTKGCCLNQASCG